MANNKTTLPLPEEMVKVLEKEGKEHYSETIRETIRVMLSTPLYGIGKPANPICSEFHKSTC